MEAGRGRVRRARRMSPRSLHGNDPARQLLWPASWPAGPQADICQALDERLEFELLEAKEQAAPCRL